LVVVRGRTLTGGKCTADDRVPRLRHVNGRNAATRVSTRAFFQYVVAPKKPRLIFFHPSTNHDDCVMQ